MEFAASVKNWEVVSYLYTKGARMTPLAAILALHNNAVAISDDVIGEMVQTTLTIKQCLENFPVARNKILTLFSVIIF